MSSATLILSQARVSTWALRLNKWLDRHPVTLDEADAAQERHTEGPIGAVPHLSQPATDEPTHERGDRSLPNEPSSSLAQRDVARRSKRMIV